MSAIEQIKLMELQLKELKKSVKDETKKKPVPKNVQKAEPKKAAPKKPKILNKEAQMNSQINNQTSIPKKGKTSINV